MNYILKLAACAAMLGLVSGVASAQGFTEFKDDFNKVGRNPPQCGERIMARNIPALPESGYTTVVVLLPQGAVKVPDNRTHGSYTFEVRIAPDLVRKDKWNWMRDMQRCTYDGKTFVSWVTVGAELRVVEIDGKKYWASPLAVPNSEVGKAFVGAELAPTRDDDAQKIRYNGTWGTYKAKNGETHPYVMLVPDSSS